MHNHHRMTIFWRTFVAPKKTFQAGGGYKKPLKKTRKTQIHHRNLSSVDPFFFLQRKVLHWSKVVYACLFPSYWVYKPDPFSRRFREGISFHPPSSVLCPFSLQNRALFEKGWGREKGRKRGAQQRGQKGKSWRKFKGQHD